MLKRSTDRKTANMASPNGKTAKIANAFGLPSGQAYSCPGATSICEKVCYAGKLEKMYPNFRNVMLNNWDALRNASKDEMVLMLTAMISEFDAECDKKNAPKQFRIHHDGDFFSLDYAKAWAQVARSFPNITFWVYTRSFTPTLNVVPVIAGIDNLAVYLSVDSDNRPYVANAMLPGIRCAFLADTFDEAKAMGDGKSTKCPELTKALDLIDKRGGACFTCGMCVKGRRDVTFSISRK